MDKDEYKDRIKKQIEVMEAFLEGKDIQVSYGGDIWDDTEYPEWNWDVIKYRVKPEEAEESKKLMTKRQLAELLAKGYGEWSFNDTGLYIYAGFEYKPHEDDDELNKDVFIRPWGSNEWLEPTVDIYEEYVSKWNRAFSWVNELTKGENESEPIPQDSSQSSGIRDYSGASKVEPKVGEVFKYNGMTLKCVEGDSCNDCVFYKTDCNPTECRKSKRYDGKMVFFVDVSKTERTTASEDSSATVSKEESVGVHRRTPQEIADFFNCYVAMDKDGEWFLYSEEPRLERYSWDSSKGLIYLRDNLGFLSFILATEDHDWRTLYRPHQEPIVNEEEEDD